MDDKEKLKLELIIKEHDSIGQATRTLFLSSQTVLGIGLTIIVTVFTIGLREKINEIFIFLPYAIYLVFFYWIHLVFQLASFGGYKGYLEERINTFFGENLVFWEMCIAKKLQISFVEPFLFVIFSILLIISMYLSIKVAQSYGELIFWANGFLLFLFFIGLIVSLYRMYGVFERTYQRAKNYSKEDVVISKSSDNTQKE